MESPFIDALKELHDGQAIRDLDRALAAVIRSGRIVGKSGAVTLKLTITPHESDEACTVAYQVDSKEPKIDPKPVFFFVDEHDKLSRVSPIERQRRLPGNG